MEVYEVILSEEESKTYHNPLLQIRKLSLRDWAYIYINMVLLIVLLCGLCTFFAEDIFLFLWFQTGVFFKSVIVIFVLSVLVWRHSKNIQMRAILQKYLLRNVPQELIGESVQLRKIKVQGNRLVVYYRKRYE